MREETKLVREISCLIKTVALLDGADFSKPEIRDVLSAFLIELTGVMARVYRLNMQSKPRPKTTR